MAERIGLIGLGVMGRPMARNLIKSGFELVVHSRSSGPVEDLVAEGGAVAADTPAAVAEQCKIVVTMLPDSPDVNTVVFGVGGLLEAMGEGHLLIDMSTIAPATAVAVETALAAKGAAAVDAPVSGGEAGAINAALSIMAGGTDDAFERSLPVFNALGTTIVHVGGPGAGQTVKACNQIVVAITYAAVSEALVLGAKAGVDPNKIVQVLSGGLASNRILELKGKNMIEHAFAPGFRIDLHRKDLNIATSSGKEYGVPLPVTGLVAQMFDALSIAGRGDLDHSAYITLVEDAARYHLAED